MRRITESTKIIGQNLRDIREIYGYSQAHVAAQIDKTFQQVQKYENGTNRLPSEVLFQLKQFYGLPYECFFKGLESEILGTPPTQHSTQDMILMVLRNVQDERARQKISEVLSALSLQKRMR
jgi:transcriptional regulator with XRE-family HTH domain